MAGAPLEKVKKIKPYFRGGAIAPLVAPRARASCPFGTIAGTSGGAADIPNSPLFSEYLRACRVPGAALDSKKNQFIEPQVSAFSHHAV